MQINVHKYCVCACMCVQVIKATEFRKKKIVDVKKCLTYKKKFTVLKNKWKWTRPQSSGN